MSFLKYGKRHRRNAARAAAELGPDDFCYKPWNWVTPYYYFPTYRVWELRELIKYKGKHVFLQCKFIGEKKSLKLQMDRNYESWDSRCTICP